MSIAATKTASDKPATTQPSTLDVTVVIPCLNEAKTLPAVIEKAIRAFDRLGVSGEIVVADNGSTDGSVELAERLGARVVRVAERGYGSALRHGMAAGRGRLLVMGDADDTYDFGEIGRFLQEFGSGAEFIMGTRLPPGTIMPGANPWMHRRVGTPVLTFILNQLFGTRIRDVNCGMRAVARDRYAQLDLRSTGMEFASEMLIKAAVEGLRVAEVPVTLHPDRRGRPPHLRRWRDGWRHLEFMLLHAPDQLLFIPGMLLVFLGLLFSVPVSLGPVHVLGRTFDFHMLFLGGALLLIGIQGVLGAVLVRDIAHGRVFHPNRLLSRAADRLTLGRGLLAGAVLFVTGFAIDAVVLLQWIGDRFGPLSEPRRGLLGLLLMTLGAEIGLCTFLHAALRKHR